MLKESDNPPAVWPEGISIADFSGRWWVAHTKSRNEKALAWQMQRQGIQYFLPMTRKVSKSRGRTIRSLLPLFAGYVFFCGSEDDRLAVLKTNRAASLIEVDDQQRLIDDLMAIAKVIGEGKELLEHRYVKAGQKCRVVAGALAGLVGIAEQDSDHWRLVLSVDLLGQSTSVEVSADMIEMVGD